MMTTEIINFFKNSRLRRFVILGALSWMVFIPFHFFDNFRKLIGDTLKLTPQSFEVFLLIVILLFCALVIYTLIIFEVENSTKIQLSHLFFFLIPILAILFFVWPIGSIDIYSYVYQGQLLAIHGQNPYFVLVDDAFSDQLFNLLKGKWSSETTLYGPLFIFFVSAVAYLGKGGVFATLLVLKLLVVCAHVLNTVLVQKIFQKMSATFLYALNPLLLFEFAVNGHNDVFIISILLLGLYVLFKKEANVNNSVFVLALLFLAFLIKATAIIFFPVFFVFALVMLKSSREKLDFAFLSGAIVLGLAVIFYLPFWRGTETLSQVIFHSNYLYNQVYSSWFLLLGIKIFEAKGLGQHLHLMVWTAKGLFAITYVLICGYLIFQRKRIKKQEIVKMFIFVSIPFYLLFFSWLMPWYYTIFIALLCMHFAQTKSNVALWGIYGTTLLGMLYYIVLR